MKQKQKIDFQKIKSELFYINKLRKYKRDCRQDTISKEKEFSLSTYAKLVNRDISTFVEYTMCCKYGLYAPSLQEEDQYNDAPVISKPSSRSRNYSLFNLSKTKPQQVTEYSDIPQSSKNAANCRIMTPKQLSKSRSQKHLPAALLTQQDSQSSFSSSFSELKKPTLSLKQHRQRRATILQEKLQTIEPDIFFLQTNETKDQKQTLRDYLTTYSYIANQSLLKGSDPFIQSKRSIHLKTQLSPQQRIKNSIEKLYAVYKDSSVQKHKRNRLVRLKV